MEFLDRLAVGRIEPLQLSSRAVRALPAANRRLVVEFGTWSAPWVMATLASIVHDRQDAARSQQHNCRDYNKQGVFHCDSPMAKGPPLFGAAGGRQEAAMASLQHPERMRTRAAGSCYGEPKSCTEAPRSPRSAFAAAKGRRFRRGCRRRSPRSRRAHPAALLACAIEDGHPDPGRGT